MKNILHQYLALLVLLFTCVQLSSAQVNISGIVNSYTAVTNIVTPACAPCDINCKDAITVGDPSAFAPGDKALIIQMKGANINTANSAAGGAITAINEAGNYEFFVIESIVGNVLTPKYNLIRNYDATGLIQVVRIPDYGKDVVTITAPVVALDWDPALGVGGVVAMQAEKIIFNDNINVIGAGFQGIQMPINGTPDNCGVNPATQYVLPSTNASSYDKGNGIVIDDPNTNRGRAPRANGGGSGVSGDSGGGGGSNYGAGGDGGWRWCDEQGPQDGGPDLPAGGVGGIALSTYLAQDKVFLGGAGGPGWVSTSNPSTAADGGGIVIIFSDTIVGNGNSILADGTSPVAVNPVGPPDGGGGGGAGGSVVLKTNTFINNLTVDLNGGNGQNLNTNNYHGPGAGGGGGVILYSLPALPGNVTLNVNGGTRGQHTDGFPNGATSGSIGGAISLYVPIQNPNYETNLDNDNTLSSCDIDDDNDGIPDIVEIYNKDHDNDGTPDYDDPDFCLATFEGINGWSCATDGLPDPSGDMDGDGRVNYKDADFPYCGTIGIGGDAVCSNFDTDGDGQPNHADLDADDDGIPDLIEAGGTDIDADGQADISTDTDGDGLVDTYDNDDTDGPQGSGPCPNQPGCLAAASTTIIPVPDNDNDGRADFLDLDADNDGIPDIVEAGGIDVNGDGRADKYTDLDDDGYNDTYDGLVCTTEKGPDQHATGFINNGTSTPANAIGAPGATFTNCGNGDDIELDLGQVVPNGTVIAITISRTGTNTNTTTQNVSQSIISGGPYSNTQLYSSLLNTATGPEKFYYVLSADARYIQIDRQSRAASIYGLTYNITTITCNNGNPVYVTGPDANTDGIPDSYPTGDTDGDGVLDHLDLDADNDGIPDVVEAGGTDTNGDGRADNYIDADNDGFNDIVDGDPTNILTSDDDNPGANTAQALQLTDSDTNNDGKADSYPSGDADNDGHLDQLDLDADNDGIPDVVEAEGTDANGDGRADNYTDTDNDGFNDVVDGDPTNALAAGNDAAGANSADAEVLTGADTDADGAPNSYPEDDNDKDLLLNQYDLDADNDGIPDVVEAGGTDVNGDGRADNYTDADNDGFNDVVDGDPTNALALANDANGANTANAQQLTGTDTNGDGVPNSYPSGDTDNDGRLDQLDLDADNDGIPDVVEAGGTDANGDGRADNYTDTDNDGFNDRVDGDPTNALALANDANGANTANAQQVTGTDTNNDGVPNSYPNDDTDGDGHRDQLDLDADNDGIPDVIEAGGTDVTGDGIADNYLDSDNDGFNDVVDGDPTNALALANDGNGANTANAQQTTGTDTNSDGVPNSYPNDDTDGDGHRDQLDLDADNDGIPDVVEAGGADVDDNGMADELSETDSDGFSSLYDSDQDNNGSVDAGPTPILVTTADGNSDGAPDNGLSRGDLDRDRVPNHLDLDADNDGILDVFEALLGFADTDSDGILDDALTNDGDNNGWSNTTDGANGGTSPVRTTDANNDGFPETYPTGDLEADNRPNFLDIDADNDGIVDNTEGQTTEGYIAPANVDTDKDGIDNNYDNNDALFGGAGSGITPANKDNIDNPDFFDIDTDNDGIGDFIEGHDTDGDGAADAGSIANTGLPGGTTDIDNDGLLDGFDNNTASSDPTNGGFQGSSYPDLFNKRTLERDWREINRTYATNDINTTLVNTTATGNVLTNDVDYEENSQLLTGNIRIDTDGDGVPETLTGLNTPVVVGGINEDGSPNANAGTLTQNTNGTYSFNPAAGFIGEVIYDYQVCDNGSPQACATAQVTIDVEPDPTTDNGELAPAPDVNTTYDDLPVSGQVLANDNDPDGDNLTVTGTIDIDINGDGVANTPVALGIGTVIAGVATEGGAPVLNAGTLIQNANGTYTFDPEPGFIGVVNYIYTVCDDGIPMTCENTTVTIDVLPSVINSTNAIDDEEFLDQGMTLNENVLINDSDLEGDNQIGGVTLVAGPTQGTLVLNPNGTYTYTPTNPNFSGNDEFVYSVCDDNAATQCDTATVYITILPVRRDYGDGPVVYGSAPHRAIRDSNLDNVLDGTSDVWLGPKTDFENASPGVGLDNFDDGITLNTALPGGFPMTVTPSTLYNVDLRLNSTSATTVFYGMWIDWDNDGVYETFYNNSVVSAGGPNTTVVAVTTPASTPTVMVNIRLRVDDQALVIGDFSGLKTNGEVEDYQFMMNDPLPVEMLYFNARLDGRNTGILDWATASELNNKGYEVEHALPTTGTPEFNQIGFVDGKGTTLETQYYNYTVPNLVTGTHYFRLKQVDFDGTSTHTQVRALEVKGSIVEDLYPTILTEASNSVFVKVAKDDNYIIEVITPLGQIVQLHQGKMLTTQYHEVEFDVNRYPSGIYFIRVSNESSSFTTKVRVE